MKSVTPCEGVGVEIEDMSKASSQPFVTPCEGVGVEIAMSLAVPSQSRHALRGRGSRNK